MLRRLLQNVALLLAASLLSVSLLELGIRLLNGFLPQRAFVLGVGGPDPPGADDLDRAALKRMLHPYYAWVDVPGMAAYSSIELPRISQGQPAPSWLLHNNRINRFGFASSVEDYASVPASRFVIGVFGGSVAKDLAAVGGEQLSKEVANRLGLPRESVVLLNFGSGGYKQPQQVIALSQMAFLGIEFDLVINLDGYNEIVAGAKDSRRGHHPLQPSQVDFGPIFELVGRQPSSRAILEAAAILEARNRSREIRARSVHSWLRHSALATATLGALALYHEHEATRLESQGQEEVESVVYGIPGPSLPDGCAGAEEPCWQLIVDIWERGSRQMAALSAPMGAQYLHVLQPNQYVEGGKTLSANELRITASSMARMPSWVRHGYPLLRERGRRMSEDGIAFHDLSMIFSDHSETIYRDPCCHFNLHGNEVLAAAIAGLVEPR